MGLFKLHGPNRPVPDPYWEFNRNNHFRPRVNVADYYRLKGYDLGEVMLKPLSKFSKDKDQELEMARSISFGQKALYFWLYLDTEVKNGGFTQFLYNGYAPYLPTIIKGMEHIGDKKMAALVRGAEAIYLKKKKQIEWRQEDNLFESDLYERLDELSIFDDEYDAICKDTLSKIEAYIRRNPNEFFVDEDGNEFNPEFSGEFKSNYPNGILKQTFLINNGALAGKLCTYYETGILKERIQFDNGEATGEREEYFENGVLRHSGRKISESNRLQLQWFHEKGHLLKLEHKDMSTGKRIGEYKEWYGNGNLKEVSYFLSDYARDGKWLKYYEDGRLMTEAEFRDGKYLLQNHWNEHGEQTLKDGTGFFVNQPSVSAGDRREENYLNYIPHGQQKIFRNGVLHLYQEMENGVAHGFEREYYRKGKLKLETLYNYGEMVSRKHYLRTENPVGKIEFEYLMKEEWLKDKELPTSDTYPVCVNEEQIKSIIEIPALLFNPEFHDSDATTCLWLSVDEDGNVTKVDFRSSHMTNGQEFLDVVEQMKFKPATKAGKNVPSFIYIIGTFEIE